MESSPCSRAGFGRSTIARKVLAALGFALMSTWVATAHVQSGVNCQSCHSTARDGMSLTGFLGTTNLGAGVLKVFQVRPGEAASIGIQVTNGRSEYGLALSNLGSGGIHDSTHHLQYQADPSWTRRTSYYSVGPRTSNQSWTFQLTVQANTPPDWYLLKMAMAGVGGGRWSQTESFYVQVVAPSPPTPQISNPHHHDTVFDCEVLTAPGFTYFLESRTSLITPTWTVVAQTPGNGGRQTLRDPAAVHPHAVYRVRVE